MRLSLTLNRFLYTLMIAVDANFRLKRRMVSNNSRDPAISSGSAYFVEDEPYREHILNYADQEDVSLDCSLRDNSCDRC